MRENEVPQENNATLGGERKAVYALRDDGRYGIVPSTGWEVEETVTSMAVEAYQRLAEEALERARRGTGSALEYHMYRLRMDPQTLAQTVGMFTWRVKRHLRPKSFARLNERLLRRYAAALDMDVAALRRLP